MSEVKITNLRCNYLENPIGTSLKPPRISWRMETDQRGAAQTAYQVQVAKDTDFNETIWDTGWVVSDISIQIAYEGPALEGMTKYFWRVRIQDEDKVTSGWGETAHWETGLKQNDWQCQCNATEREKLWSGRPG